MYLKKGDRVTAKWMEAKPVSLSGVMFKLEGRWKSVTGVVTHIWSDNPTEPTSIGVSILDDDNKEHWVDLNHIKSIEK